MESLYWGSDCSVSSEGASRGQRRSWLPESSMLDTTKAHGSSSKRMAAISLRRWSRQTKPSLTQRECVRSTLPWPTGERTSPAGSLSTGAAAS